MKGTIIFIENKPFFRVTIAKKKIPLASDITELITKEFDGKDAEGELGEENGKDAIKKVIIDGKTYDSKSVQNYDVEPQKPKNNLQKPKKEPLTAPTRPKLNLEVDTGKLIIEDGNYFFQPRGGQRINIGWLYYPQTFANNTTIDVELVADTVVKIIYKDTEYTNPLPKTPYNFIPLNEKVVYPEEQFFTFDKYEGNSGFIDISVENKTPLFIRGDKTDFLKINRKTILAGSSLRGLIRNAVEIVSYSKLTFYNNTRFYFRAFADKDSKLKYEYALQISKQEKVGILYKDFKTGNYYLMPSKLIKKIDAAHRKDSNKYKFQTTFWNVYTGHMDNKKVDYQIAHEQLNKAKALEMKWDSDVIKEYKNDVTRMKDFSVLDKIDKSWEHKNNGIPVFYQTSEEDATVVTSFGNTRNYRLPYKTKVNNHLYPAHNQMETVIDENNEAHEKLDFANLIFGKVSEEKGERTVTSRVFFEDLTCEQPKFHTESLLKILSGPKPTSYQLYLSQPENAFISKHHLNNWNDSKAIIRGYKQYWHRDTSAKSPEHYNAPFFVIKEDHLKNYLRKVAGLNDDQMKEVFDVLQRNQYAKIREKDRDGKVKIEFNGDLSLITDAHIKKHIIGFLSLDGKKAKGLDITLQQNAFIKAMEPKNVFTGRIRFENLTDEELGALLFALNLPPNCCYKMGMGKPLGLGTVAITVEGVTLSNNESKYTKLLNNEGELGSWWHPQDTSKTISTFINSFEDRMKKELGTDKPLWDNDRLFQFKKMLYFAENGKYQTPEWLDKTRYMEIERLQYDKNGKQKMKPKKKPNDKDVPLKVNEYSDRNVLPSPDEVISQ